VVLQQSAWEGEEEKIIARERAYHGCTVLAGSLTGLRFYQDNMDLPISVFCARSPALLLGAESERQKRRFHRGALPSWKN